jgi:hypothetical protein
MNKLTMLVVAALAAATVAIGALAAAPSASAEPWHPANCVYIWLHPDHPVLFCMG